MGKMYLFELVFCFFLDIYPKVELLDHICSFGETSILFSTVAAPVYTRQQCTGVPFSANPGQHLLFVFFLMIAILTSMRWYLIVVLFCISLMISNAEHLSTCCWLSTFPLWEKKKCLFRSSAHFLIRLLLFWMWVVWAMYVYWILTSYQSYHLQTFSPIP